MLESQKEFIQTLTPLEKEYIRMYTANFYLDFNWRLREHIPLTAEQTELKNILDSCFQRVPRLEQPLVVYRGIKAHKSKLTEFSHFMSCSLSYQKARSFTKWPGCLLEITVIQGSKVLPLESISDMQEQEEQEVLLCDGNFQFQREDQDDGISCLIYTCDNAHKFDMEELCSECIIPKVEKKSVERDWISLLESLIDSDEVDLLGIQEVMNLYQYQYKNNIPLEVIQYFLDKY